MIKPHKHGVAATQLSVCGLWFVVEGEQKHKLWAAK